MVQAVGVFDTSSAILPGVDNTDILISHCPVVLFVRRMHVSCNQTDRGLCSAAACSN